MDTVAREDELEHAGSDGDSESAVERHSVTETPDCRHAEGHKIQTSFVSKRFQGCTVSESGRNRLALGYTMPGSYA